MIQIDIPIPKSCGRCYFEREGWFYPYCVLLDGNIEEYRDEGRHPDCPLIEVGDVHD